MMNPIQDTDAREPAAALSAPSAKALPKEYLTFRLGGEEYGIDILRVQEIRRYENPTRIVNAAAFIKGVVNLRGVIVPVVDLRQRLGMGSAVQDDVTVFVVLNVRGRTLGVMVDSVSDVVAPAPEDIRAVPPLGSAFDASPYILGIACLESAAAQRMLILMDIEALLGSADMSAIDAVSG